VSQTVKIPMLRYPLLEYVVGPVYLGISFSFFLGLHALGLPHYQVYYLASLGVIVLTQLLEWAMPYEKSWNEADGQLHNELAHTFISAMLGHNVGRILAIGLFGSIVSSWGYAGAPWWPKDIPFVLQVILAFAIWELGLYWNHRFMHGPTWGIHHLHHKLRRLSWINSGYGHPIQFVLTSLFDLSFLMLSGAPAGVMVFVIYLSGTVNFLPHANVRMRMGLLNYIFATPEVHRWHHEKTPMSGKRNFGMQLIIWDLIFGTYYNPKTKDTPRILGDLEPQPSGFFQQWLAPFVPKYRERWKQMPAERRKYRQPHQVIESAPK